MINAQCSFIHSYISPIYHLTRDVMNRYVLGGKYIFKYGLIKILHECQCSKYYEGLDGRLEGTKLRRLEELPQGGKSKQRYQASV